MVGMWDKVYAPNAALGEQVGKKPLTTWERVKEWAFGVGRMIKRALLHGLTQDIHAVSWGRLGGWGLQACVLSSMFSSLGRNNGRVRRGIYK